MPWSRLISSLQNRTSICRRPHSPYMQRRPSYYGLYSYGYGYNSYRDWLGCNRVCTKMTWAVKCCKNHFGRDCQGENLAHKKQHVPWMLDETMQPKVLNCVLVCGLVCPGGLEAPCGEHGDCDDGRTGTGMCKCHKGFTGTGCELCKSSHFGPNCTGNLFKTMKTKWTVKSDNSTVRTIMQIEHYTKCRMEVQN